MKKRFLWLIVTATLLSGCADILLSVESQSGSPIYSPLNVIDNGDGTTSVTSGRDKPVTCESARVFIYEQPLEKEEIGEVYWSEGPDVKCVAVKLYLHKEP